MPEAIDTGKMERTGCNHSGSILSQRAAQERGQDAMSFKAWDRLFRETEVFAAEHPDIGVSLVYLMPGYDPPISALFPRGHLPAMNEAKLARELYLGDTQASTLVVHDVVRHIGRLNGYGDGCEVIWGLRGEGSTERDGRHLVRLMRRLAALTRDTAHLDFPQAESPAWPQLFRHAWATGDTAEYSTRTAWRVVQTRTPDREASWFVESEVTPTGWQLDERRAATRAREFKHEHISGEIHDWPLELEGYWCSTISGAAFALVGAIETSQSAVVPGTVSLYHQVEAAYGAAAAMLDSLQTLLYHLRRYDPDKSPRKTFNDLGATYALSLIPWHSLRTRGLSNSVRTTARLVYPPNAPAVRIGRCRPCSSVVELLADEIGVGLRNMVFLGRSCEIETAAQMSFEAALLYLRDEWSSLDDITARHITNQIKSSQIDFEELAVSLQREATAALEHVRARTPSEPSARELKSADEQTAESGRGGDRSDEEATSAMSNGKELPEKQPWAMEAWRASLAGATQTDIATQLNQKYGGRYGTITQPRVSEQIKIAKQYADASGLDEIADKAFSKSKGNRRPSSMDPSSIDRGKRTNKWSTHIVQKTQQDYEDDDR